MYLKLLISQIFSNVRGALFQRKRLGTLRAVDPFTIRKRPILQIYYSNLIRKTVGKWKEGRK